MSASTRTRQLFKNDRRQQWKLLKTKHKAALTAARLDFDLKLGKALDKYQAQVDKLNKLAAQRELKTEEIQPVMDISTAIDKIALTYRNKINALPNPAKKELTAFFKAVDTDRQGWDHVALELAGSPSAPTDAQKKAAAELGRQLDTLRAQAITLMERSEPVRMVYVTGKGIIGAGPRPAAAELMSRLIEAARLAGASANELANAADRASRPNATGTQYQMFKQRAVAAAPLIKRLGKLVQMYKDGWESMAADVLTLLQGEPEPLGRIVYNQTPQILEYCGNAIKLIGKLP